MSSPIVYVSPIEPFPVHLYSWDVAGMMWVVQPVITSGGGGGGAVTIADGADVAEGATTDAAVFSDATGTVSAKLRGLVKLLAEGLAKVTVSAASLPLPAGASTEATLAQVKVNTDPFGVSTAGGFFRQDSTATVAKETGGNLDTIAANTTGVSTAANQAAGNASLASIDTKLTSPLTVVSNKSHNADVPGTTNLGVLPAIATAAAPTYVEGNQVGLSTDLAGNVRISGSISANSSADVVEDDAVDLYTVGDLAKNLTQDVDGRLRVSNPEELQGTLELLVEETRKLRAHLEFTSGVSL